MRCDHAFDDAGYVIGALPPEERQEYVAHMAGCADCRNSVRELAGLPGLLARVEPGEIAGVGAPHEPAPPTILPRLMAAVAFERAKQRRRRRTYSLAVAACLALLALAAVPVSLAVFRDKPPVSVATGAPPSAVAMRPVDQPVPVRAAVGVSDTDWGATISLRCSYAVSEYAGKQSYALYAVPRTGAAEQIGSWTVGPGEEITTTAATRLHRADLRSLEIRRTDGTPILRADL